MASEQHGGQPIPERLPSEKEVSELIDISIWLKSQLENVRDIVQHSMAEKARDSNRNDGTSYDGDDDISMYGDNVKPSPYGLGESKKRRGVSAVSQATKISTTNQMLSSARHHQDVVIAAIA